eukprot:CAMPEP_0197635548 /NCGR_PEP_ID=MMETSP1338-20131121/11335_1 /TAXON_ID=43686 ORGANISM="Pelagodinium beii, Strain RCC1491" /NCGR_SAMPLE_ID=MMETSP1338 /ASSEMBLY_ACC=CAM_ASM_000754 /LENGTH=721 /DNA_ID=CAMNT_0043207623 /DNA_START=34 /DNA_END=2196 /DNA_ORIENTATION=-
MTTGPNEGAEAYHIVHAGGEAFINQKLPSDQRLLWGELVKESERNFFRRHLQQEESLFAIVQAGTFQIRCECCWQEEGKLKPGMNRRRGRFVALVHGLSSSLNDSWAWMKLWKPFFKTGFSVVSIELPGYGRSSISNKLNGPKSDWWDVGWKVIDRSVKQLGIPRCHFVGMGESCHLLLDMMLHSRVDHCSLVAREHFWYQPIIDFKHMFKDLLGQPPPNSTWWKDFQHSTIVKALQEVIIHVRIWMIYNDKVATPEERRTYEILKEATAHVRYRDVFRLSEVSESDLCSAQIHATLPTRCLVVGKSLCQTLMNFLYIPDTDWDKKVVMPTYEANALVNRAFAKDYDPDKCLVGCADLEEGKHLPRCPNHMSNRIVSVDGTPNQVKDAFGKILDFESMPLMPHEQPKKRPSSAPAAQRVSPAPGTLLKARGRAGQPGEWMMSQAHGCLVQHADRKSMHMVSCLSAAQSLRAKDNALQHRVHCAKLNKKQKEVATKTSADSAAEEQKRIEEMEAEMFRRKYRYQGAPEKELFAPIQMENAPVEIRRKFIDDGSPTDESPTSPMSPISFRSWVGTVATSKNGKDEGVASLEAETTQRMKLPEPVAVASPASPSSQRSTTKLSSNEALPQEASPAAPGSRRSTKISFVDQEEAPSSRNSTKEAPKESGTLSRASTKDGAAELAVSSRPSSSSMSRTSSAASRPRSASRLNGFLSGALTAALRPT